MKKTKLNQFIEDFGSEGKKMYEKTLLYMLKRANEHKRTTRTQLAIALGLPIHVAAKKRSDGDAWLMEVFDAMLWDYSLFYVSQPRAVYQTDPDDPETLATFARSIYVDLRRIPKTATITIK